MKLKKKYGIWIFVFLLVFVGVISACSEEEGKIETVKPEDSESGDSSGTIPTVENITPVKQAINVSKSTNITVTFDIAMDPSTITANSSDTSCTGTVQVSNDGFSSCIQMDGNPSPDGENKVFTLIPGADLTLEKTYVVKVTTGAKSEDGMGLSTDYAQSNGFIVSEWIVIFKIDTPSNGNFASSHDSDCQGAKTANNIGGANVAPFISNDSTDMEDVGPGSGKKVVSKNGSQISSDWGNGSSNLFQGTQDATWYDAGVLDDPSDKWWSGSNSNGTKHFYRCNNGGAWTDDSNAYQGVVGVADDTASGRAIDDSSYPTCNNVYYKLCVAW